MGLHLNVITVDELHHDKWLTELIKMDSDFSSAEAKEKANRIIAKHEKAPMTKEDMVQAVTKLFAKGTDSQHVLGNRNYTSEFEYDFTQISTYGYILSISYYIK
jgi:hypothetical protein